MLEGKPLMNKDLTQAQLDRRRRERLERASIDEGRANPVDALNKMAAQDAVQRFEIISE
jgi:hypothetical protein